MLSDNMPKDWTPTKSFEEVSISISEADFKEILELLKASLDDAVELRDVHDAALGRDTRKNKHIGEMYDNQISRLDHHIYAMSLEINQR